MVIIDEALSFIDTEYLDRIIDSLIKLKLRSGSTLVIIEKNPYVLKKLINYSPKFIVLEDGVKVFDGILNYYLSSIKEHVCSYSRFMCKLLHYMDIV